MCSGANSKRLVKNEQLKINKENKCNRLKYIKSIHDDTKKASYWSLLEDQ